MHSYARPAGTDGVADGSARVADRANSDTLAQAFLLGALGELDADDAVPEAVTESVGEDPSGYDDAVGALGELDMGDAVLKAVAEGVGEGLPGYDDAVGAAVGVFHGHSGSGGPGGVYTFGFCLA